MARAYHGGAPWRSGAAGSSVRSDSVAKRTGRTVPRHVARLPSWCHKQFLRQKREGCKAQRSRSTHADCARTMRPAGWRQTSSCERGSLNRAERARTMRPAGWRRTSGCARGSCGTCSPAWARRSSRSARRSARGPTCSRRRTWRCPPRCRPEHFPGYHCQGCCQAASQLAPPTCSRRRTWRCPPRLCVRPLWVVSLCER